MIKIRKSGAALNIDGTQQMRERGLAITLRSIASRLRKALSE